MNNSSIGPETSVLQELHRHLEDKRTLLQERESEIKASQKQNKWLTVSQGENFVFNSIQLSYCDTVLKYKHRNTTCLVYLDIQCIL